MDFHELQFCISSTYPDPSYQSKRKLPRVLIPSHSFSALYKAIDSDRDGLIQVSELIDYVAKIKPGGLSTRRRRLTTLSFMFSQISLYLIFVQILAGSVQTHAALVGLSTINATKRTFLFVSRELSLVFLVQLDVYKLTSSLPLQVAHSVRLLVPFTSLQYGQEVRGHFMIRWSMLSS